MNGFRRIEIDGFRRLRGLSLEMRPLCALIGANGSGKTSFLEAFSLLAASAQGGLASRISDSGGIEALARIGGPPHITFGISGAFPQISPLGGQLPAEGPLAWPPSLFDYQLELGAMGNGYLLTTESLSQARSGDESQPLKHIDSRFSDVKYFKPSPARNTLASLMFSGEPITPTWQYDHLETALSQVPKTFPEPEAFRQRLASSTFYHALDVERGARVRLPQPMQPASLPGKDGEHLASCLYALQQTDRDRFEAIEDALRAAFPSFERLDFPPVANGTLALTWRERPFSKSISAHQLSEGTLRFLWLATLLQSPGLTGVTLIDEPEVSLHPELLSLLAGLLREASARSQIILATHSDLLVRFLEPEEVLVVDLDEEGGAKLAWADALDLKQWLQEYTLDEIWRMGRMGGRR